MAYIAKADGTKEPIATPISLKQAQKAVGGYVQRFFINGLPLLCDEEGLIKRKPLNERVTQMAQEAMASFAIAQPFVGDIIVFETKKEAKGWIR